MFSIVIPTYNNLKYLKLCLESLKKNSTNKHEIIIHVNVGDDGTLEYVKENKFIHTFSNQNIGLCSSINLAAKKISSKYILYSHDDMYFCPKWDEFLIKEVNKLDHEKFYFSGTMIEPFTGHISYNCGDTIDNFNEKKLLDNWQTKKFYDHQGSHFAPHLVEKKMWDKIGGFSEEFNPGITSDPDFNMKLWKEGVRTFKGIDQFRVYHFSSITTRKKIGLVQNKGENTFLKKWGISTKFFKKHYLKSYTKYHAPLNNPKKSFTYYKDLLICKIKFSYITIFQ